jgi:hypothetical protein
MAQDAAWLSLAWAVPATLAHLAIVAIALRLSGPRAALPTMLAAAAAVFGAGMWLGGDRLSFWHFGAALGLGVAAVVFLYGAVLKSLSIDLLLCLADAPDGQASLGVLVERVVRPRFAERAAIIVRKGLGEHVSTGVRSTPRAASAAARLTRLRKRLRVEGAGLYDGTARAREKGRRAEADRMG